MQGVVNHKWESEFLRNIVILEFNIPLNQTKFLETYKMLLEIEIDGQETHMFLVKIVRKELKDLSIM